MNYHPPTEDGYFWARRSNSLFCLQAEKPLLHQSGHNAILGEPRLQNRNWQCFIIISDRNKLHSPLNYSH